MSHTREDLQEMLHDCILAALDEFARNVLGMCENRGWKDEDLPEMFQALDKHLDVLIKRSNEE